MKPRKRASQSVIVVGIDNGVRPFLWIAEPKFA